MDRNFQKDKEIALPSSIGHAPIILAFVPSIKKLRNLSPLISIYFMGVDECQFLLFGPSCSFYLWVQMVVPPEQNKQLLILASDFIY